MFIITFKQKRMKHILLFLFATHLAFCQTTDIVGISRGANNGGEVFLASIDPSTGVLQDISNTSYSNVIANFSYTVNPVSDIFYYADQTALVGIDMNNGSLVSNPTITTSIQPFFQSFIYNELTQEIIGLERGANNGGEVYLAKINPNSGVVTPISQTSITNSISLNGGQTIDLANQWFHFISNSKLYTVDIATGNTIYNPLIDTSSALYFDNIIYNEFDGNVYGLARNANPPEIFLARINPIDGVVTYISQTSIGQSFTLAGAAINPFSNTYFYKANENFVGVDITTGSVTSNPPIDYSQSNGDFFDYYYYPNEKISLLSNSNFSTKTDIEFYPNPTRNFISIENRGLDKIEIVDVSGRLMLSLKNHNNTFDVSNLPSGTYFIKAVIEGMPYTKKLIKK